MKNICLHDKITSFILSLKPVIKKVSTKKYYRDYYDESEDLIEEFKEVGYLKKEIKVLFCKDKAIPTTSGLLSFNSCCPFDELSVLRVLGLSGRCIDIYDNMIVGNELLLVTAGDFEEQNTNEKGFCHIAGFVTINKKGLVRYSQIVYSFLFNRVVVRDSVSVKLPFKPNLEKDFGGKYALFRRGARLVLHINRKRWTKLQKEPDNHYYGYTLTNGHGWLYVL